MSSLRAVIPAWQTREPTDGAVEREQVSTLPGPGTDEYERLVADGFNQYTARRFAEALRLINLALARRPDAHDALYARASIMFAWGRFDEAFAAYKRAGAAGVEHAEFYVHQGRSYPAMDAKAAEACMRKAVSLEPEWWEGHFRLAAVLQAEKQPDEAIREYRRALELRPDCIDCYTGLGNCELDRKDAVAAESHYRRVVEADGSRPEAWGNLGVALDRQQRLDEALAAFEQAERLDSKASNVDSYYNVAIALADGERVHEALALLESNLAERPGVLAYNAYALGLLALGRFREGWNVHHFRWLLEQYLPTRPKFRSPRWDGQDLRGKTILLLNEQGLGDTIQFLRYVPYIKATGAKVLLRVQGPLQELVKGLAGVDLVVDESGNYAFDMYSHLMSLPELFGTELRSIPARVPYLHPDPESVDRWAPRIGSGHALKVGLVWAGNPIHMRDKYRSVALSALAPVLNVKTVRFFLLQKGPAAAEAESLKSGTDVVNLGPDLEHLGDTAAVISHLDLLICVDTSVAHLAGALGKPVWLLLPRPSDWRWLLEREDSPWYPTMRLFRQAQRNHWGEVITRVANALAKLAQSHVPPVATDSQASPPTLQPVQPVLPRLRPGHLPGFCAVAECRHGIFQYFPDEPLIGDSLGWYGEYLEPQLHLLLRLIRPGATVLEAAAGVGAHTVPLARASGPDGYLLVYEPRRVARRVLQHNLGANEVRNVSVMRRQLGCETGSIDGTGARSRPPAIGAETPDDMIFETVDDLQLERLHLLKINEGVDAIAVIAGATDTLWRLRPLLFIAARDEAALKGVTARAKDYAYRCWRMETPLFSPSNFNARQDDISGGRSVLALLAIPEEAKANIAFEGCVEL